MLSAPAGAPLRAKLVTETPTNGEPAAVIFIAGDAIATAGGTLKFPSPRASPAAFRFAC